MSDPIILSIVISSIAQKLFDMITTKLELLLFPKLQEQTKSIIKDAITISKKEIKYIPDDNLNGFLNDDKNEAIIVSWIIEDVGMNDSLEFQEFDIKAYIDEQYYEEIKTFLKKLKSTIIELKLEVFTPESQNILDRLHLCDRKLDKIEKQNELVLDYNTEMLSMMRSMFASISKDNPDNGTNISIREISKHIDEGKLYTARQKALEIKSTQSQMDKLDNESKYLLNAYIAQTYINALTEQKEAIPYLYEADKYCMDEFKRYKNLGYIKLLEGDYKTGLIYIEKALTIKPSQIDAIRIKAQLLEWDKQLDEAREFLISVNIEDNPQFLFSFAQIEFKKQNYMEAKLLSEQAIQKKSDYFEPYFLIAEILNISVQESLEMEGQISEELFAEINKLIDSFNYLITTLNNEQDSVLVHSLTILSVLKSWINEHSSAKEVLLEAYSIHPNNLDVLRNLILVDLELLEYNSVRKYIDAYRAIDDKEIEINLIDKRVKLLTTDNISAFIQELQEFVESNGSVDIRYEVLLVEAFNGALQTGNAEKKIEDLLKRYGNIPEVFIAQLEHYNHVYNYEKIISLENDIPSNCSRRSIIAINSMIANAYFSKSPNTRDNYIKAANLYKDISNIHTNNIFLKRYISSLFLSSQYESCIIILNKIEQIHGFNEYFKAIEAQIKYNTENYQDAGIIYEKLAQYQPHNLEYIILYANCLFKIGQADRALDVLKQVYNRNIDDVEILLSISTIFAANDQYEEAIDLSEKALKIDNTKPEYHLHYITLFLKAEKSSFKFNQQSIKTFQTIMDGFNEKFPEHPGIQKIEFKNDETFIEQLSEILREREAVFEDYLSTYSKNRMPLCFLANGKCENIINTWINIVNANEDDFKIWFSSGNNISSLRELDIVLHTDKVLIDAVCILTLNELDLLEKIPCFFSEIFITQSTFDIFRDVVHKYELHNNGYTSTGIHGKLITEGIPAEVINKQKKEIREIIEFISSNMTIIGKSPSRHGVKEEYENLQRSLGEATFETIMEGNINKNTIMFEDVSLRKLIEQKFKLKTFGTNALIKAFQIKGIISDYQYNELLLKLIHWGYHFVSIDEDTLEYILNDTSFYVNNKSLVPFEYLKHKDHDVDSIINLYFHFIKWLWLESITLESKVKWTIIILESINHQRNKRQIMREILSRKRVFSSIIEMPIEQQYESTIQDWVRAQQIL